MDKHATERAIFEASARTGFSDNKLNRREEWRGDAAILAEILRSKQARFIFLRQDKALICNVGESIGIRHEYATAALIGVDWERAIFLGEDEFGPLWAFGLSEYQADSAPQDSCVFIDLRSLAIETNLAPGDLGILAQSRSMFHWHNQHRFCGRCGASYHIAHGGYKLECSACSAISFPRTDPVAIMLVVDGDRLLLGRQHRFLPGSYSCLAGFIEPGETIENAVRREILEEAGIQLGEVQYYASQPWPFPASLMIGCVGKATTYKINMDEEELEDCRWFSTSEVEKMVAREHPEGLIIPPKMAIANIIISGYLEGRMRFG